MPDVTVATFPAYIAAVLRGVRQILSKSMQHVQAQLTALVFAVVSKTPHRELTSKKSFDVGTRISSRFSWQYVTLNMRLSRNRGPVKQHVHSFRVLCMDLHVHSNLASLTSIWMQHSWAVHNGVNGQFVMKLNDYSHLASQNIKLQQALIN